MPSTRNQLPDRATAKPRPVKNNTHRVLCRVCGLPIPAYAGVPIDAAEKKTVRDYRHPACPNPKSRRRDPHALGKHVLRTTSNGRERYCAVRGCRYRECWSETTGEFLPYDARLRSFTAPEPALINLSLFASDETTRRLDDARKPDRP